MEFRRLAFDDLETRLEDEGSFAGYACRWNTVDSYGTQFSEGSFVGSTRSQKLPLLFMHSPENPVGTFTWREDAEGLHIEGRFDKTDEGERARQRALSGSAPELSVGFIRRGVDPDDETRITAAELKEVSAITLGFASQRGAELVAVRKVAEEMQRMDAENAEEEVDETRQSDAPTETASVAQPQESASSISGGVDFRSQVAAIKTRLVAMRLRK